MNIVFWLKGNRGIKCLKKILEEGFKIRLLVLQPQKGSTWYREAVHLAAEHKIPLIEPDDPNSSSNEQSLKACDPDLFVLAGYGKIIKALFNWCDDLFEPVLFHQGICIEQDNDIVFCLLDT